MPEEHTDSIRSWTQILDGVNKRTEKKKQRTDTTQRNQTKP
jgi:hypothetical protein